MLVASLLWLAVGAAPPTSPPTSPPGSPPATVLADEAPPSLAPLDVARAVLARNPSAAAARLAVRAAREAARGEGAFPEPMLEGRLAPLSLPAGPFVDDSVPLGFELMLSQPVPLTDRLGQARAAAEAEAEAMAAEERALRLELAERGAMLACDAWELSRTFDVNAHHRDTLVAMQSAARDAVAAGRGTVDEALRIDDEVAALVDEDLARAAALDVVKARLNALLHRVPDAPLPAPPAELPPLDEGDGDAPDPGRPGSVVTPAAHPAVDVARARARAALARAEEAAGRAVPDLFVTASYSSMWPEVQHQLMVGVAVELPTATEARDASVERARAEREVAARLAEERTDLVAADARISARRLEEARARAALFGDQRLPLAARRSAAARTAFAAGQGSLLESLMTQRDERHVALEAERARAEVCRREASLRRARGVDLPAVTATHSSSLSFPSSGLTAPSSRNP